MIKKTWRKRCKEGMFHREMPVKRSSDGNDKKREEKREGGEAKCNYEAGIE